MLHRIIGVARAPWPPSPYPTPPSNRNASNDKLVTKTAIGFSVLPPSLGSTSTASREDLFFGLHLIYGRNSALRPVKTFFLSRSLVQTPALGVKSSNYYIRFVCFHLLNFLFNFFFYKKCARGAKTRGGVLKDVHGLEDTF